MGIPSFCRSGRPDADQPVRLKSFQITVPGCGHMGHAPHSVKGRIGGNGFTLIFLHGYTANSLLVLLFLGLLARRFKVIALDLAGHGGTRKLTLRCTSECYADLVAKVAHQLGVKKSLTVAHSFGAQIASKVASQHPERTIALGLANPVVGEAWDRRMAHVRRFLYLPIVPIGVKLAVDLTKTMAHVKRTDQSPTLRQLAWESYRGYILHPHDLLGPLLALIRATTVCDLRKIHEAKVPVVLLWDSLDPVIGPEDAESISRLTDAFVVETKEPIGHNWPMARRQTVSDLVDELLEGVLGDVLRHELTVAGLDPESATQADIENSSYFYEPGSLVFALTPEHEIWEEIIPDRVRYLPRRRQAVSKAATEHEVALAS